MQGDQSYPSSSTGMGPSICPTCTLGFTGAVLVSPQATGHLRQEPVMGAQCAGSSSQKRFFLLTKSSAQTFPFCSESLKTLAKPFPLIFLHLAKTTQTVCLQGRLSQDMGEESIICNARKYNLHISKAFSVKTNTQQRLGGQTPIAFKLPCLAIVWATAWANPINLICRLHRLAIVFQSQIPQGAPLLIFLHSSSFITLILKGTYLNPLNLRPARCASLASNSTFRPRTLENSASFNPEKSPVSAAGM